MVKARTVIWGPIAVALAVAGCTSVTVVVPATTSSPPSTSAATVPVPTPAATRDLGDGSSNPTVQVTLPPTGSPPGPTPGPVLGSCAVRLERGDTVIVLHEPVGAGCDYLAENTHLAVGGNWSIAADIPLADSLICHGEFGNAAIPFEVWDSGDHHWGDLVCQAYR